MSGESIGWTLLVLMGAGIGAIAFIFALMKYAVSPRKR